MPNSVPKRAAKRRDVPIRNRVLGSLSMISLETGSNE